MISGPGDSVDFETAHSLFLRAVAEGNNGNIEKSLIAFEEIVLRFGGSGFVDVRGIAAEALLNRAAVFEQTGRIEAAISGLDDLVAQFGDDEDEVVAIHVAYAMNNKGAHLWQLGAKSSALGAYRASVARFGDSRTPRIAERVIDALDSIRALQWDLGFYDDAARAAREVIRRTANGTPSTLRWRARALTDVGLDHRRRGKSKAALNAFDAVIQLDEKTNDPTELDASVAWAYANKAAVLCESKRYDEAFAAADALSARFEGRDDPDVRSAIAAARVNKEHAQQALRRPPGAP